MENLKSGILAQENMFLFPLLCEGSSSVLDYFPKERLCIWEGKDHLSQVASEDEYPKLIKNHELFEKNLTPVGTLESLFLTPSQFETQINKTEDYFFEPFQEREADKTLTLTSRDLSLSAERTASHQKSSSHPSLDAFAKKFRDWMDEGYRISVVSHTQVHADRFSMLFSPYGIKVSQHGETEIPWHRMPQLDFNEIHVWQGFLRQNRIYPSLKTIILSEEEIFGVKKKSSRTTQKVSQTNKSYKQPFLN